MEYLEHQITECKKTKVDELIERMKSIDFHLHQETADKLQLNLQERLVSIQNIWNAVKLKIGDPKTALDVGAGFAYGTVFLDMNGIKTVGIKNVHAKNTQAFKLFRKLGVTINKVNKVDFSKSPAIFETDFNEMQGNEVADLITMFYLSGELVMNPKTLQVCEKLLKKDGRCMFSTEANRSTIKK
ncbi:hypothetical protein HY750_01475 [Candidatus Kuenenbacteria bacterium]|nr:hypothetical protein [Candidatus Kuenenbacteria bacterium]